MCFSIRIIKVDLEVYIMGVVARYCQIDIYLIEIEQYTSEESSDMSLSLLKRSYIHKSEAYLGPHQALF